MGSTSHSWARTMPFTRSWGAPTLRRQFASAREQHHCRAGSKRRGGWWPGAESKNSPQVAPILTLATVRLLGVHAGVHQTDHRSEGKFGFEPLTYPTTASTLCSSPCSFAQRFDWPCRHCPGPVVEHLPLSVSVFKPLGARGATAQSPARSTSTHGSYAHLGHEGLLQTDCCRSKLAVENRRLTKAHLGTFLRGRPVYRSTGLPSEPDLRRHRRGNPNSAIANGSRVATDDQDEIRVNGRFRMSRTCAPGPKQPLWT